MCGAQEEVGELVLFRASPMEGSKRAGVIPSHHCNHVRAYAYILCVCVCANCECTHHVAAICVVKGTCIC